MRRGPPVDRRFPWLELRREVRLEDIEITIPTGDSFEMSLEETRLYLRVMAVPDLKAEKALDKLWNFYAIRLQLSGDYEHETLPPPQYPEITGPRPLEDFGWVIEAGRLK